MHMLLVYDTILPKPLLY